MPGVIDYDNFSDFEQPLFERGVDCERLSELERQKIVDSYPFDPYDDDAEDADAVWAQTGGPWMDATADRLIAAGFGSDEDAGR